MSHILSFVRKIDVSASQADERTFEAKPRKAPIDYAALGESIYARFSKSFEKLAQ